MSDVLAGEPIPLQPPFFRPSHAHPLWRHALFLFVAQLLLAAGSPIPLQPPLFRPSHRHPFWRHFFFLRLPQRPSRVTAEAREGGPRQADEALPFAKDSTRAPDVHAVHSEEPADAE